MATSLADLGRHPVPIDRQDRHENFEHFDFRVIKALKSAGCYGLDPKARN